MPGGILLWGPPGTGKTLMAQAVAGETAKPFVFVDPGAFINMFMGVGILKVKSLFRKLRKLSLRYGGVIVFFDEADSLGNRGARSRHRRSARVYEPGIVAAPALQRGRLRVGSRARTLRSMRGPSIVCEPGAPQQGAGRSWAAWAWAAAAWARCRRCSPRCPA